MAGDPPPQLVGDVRLAIDQVFSAEDPLKMMERLEELKGPNARVESWAIQTKEALRERSPTSVWVTQAALIKARDMILRDAFEMEMRLAQAYCVVRLFLFGFRLRRLPARYAHFTCSPRPHG